MILSTPGFVLHTTPYGETSVVAKVFTRLSGLQSFIIKGIRGSRARVKQNLLQPLSCLDMVVYHSPHSDLHHVRELTVRHPALPPDPVDAALHFFIAEVLYKSLPDDEPMPLLWDYIERRDWDAPSPLRRHIPLQFMLELARHLGIQPLDNHSSLTPNFSLQEGRFLPFQDPTSLSPQLSALLHLYLSAPPLPSSTSPAQREALLDALIAYYQLHLAGFRNLHSHEILHTIFM